MTVRPNRNLFQASSTPLIAGLMKCSFKERSTKSHNSSIDTAIEELPDEGDDGKGKLEEDKTQYTFMFKVVAHLCAL